jgi:signal transduction histidine kinase
MEHDKLIVAPAITVNGRFLQILISPVKDETKSYLGAVVLFHDITKEKELEKMREDFTSMMVHELRSPLTGIKSIAGLLTNDKVKGDNQKFEQFVRLISTNSQDMLELVNDLLDVAKLESGKFQLLKKVGDIGAVIQTRVDSFKTLAEQGTITLTAKIDPKTPKTLEFDEHKIVQVFNNFISNAIKFTRTGGTIVVAAFVLSENKDLAQEVVEQKLVWPGIHRGVQFTQPVLVVAVTDSGLGIPPAQIQMLFNKFVQLENAAKSEKKGSGLGLVISKGIIEAHQGKIGVFSEEGEGSTFYFTLPIMGTPTK